MKAKIQFAASFVLLMVLVLLFAFAINAQTLHSVSVAWSPAAQPAGITLLGWNVKRAATSAGPFNVLVPTLAAGMTGYTDNDVTPGATYYYAVSSWTSAGESVNSDVASVTVPGDPVPPPPAPTCPGSSFFATSAMPVGNGGTGENELGMKLSAKVAWTINCVRFYKMPGAGTAHVWTIWSSTGTKLASGNFGVETSAGWQVAQLAAPVSVAANSTVTVSYNTGTGGQFAYSGGYFTAAKTDATGTLTAPVNAGVYHGSTSNTFPTTSFNAANYSIDIYFTAAAAPPPPPPAITISCAIAVVGVSNLPSGSYSMSVTSGSKTVTCTGIK